MVVGSRDREAVRAAASAVLQVTDYAVATLADGYAVEPRDLVRREETLRRELIDDLFRGDSDLGTLVERAEPFGLGLARVHQVALAAPSRRLPDADAAINAPEEVMFDRLATATSSSQPRAACSSCRPRPTPKQRAGCHPRWTRPTSSAGSCTSS